jgi:molybdate transport system substrate-binding protein
VFNFAASSELARQIAQGADADIFVSADEAWMDYLAERGLIEPATRRTLLANRLVLIAPTDRPLSIEIKDGMDLKAALKGGKLAIGNPDSVPAGRYAKEALGHFGVWPGLEDDAAYAENVRAALRLVESGEAAAGIVYATDARASGGKILVASEFPPDSHTPITYPVAVVAGKNDGPGPGFVGFLDSAESQAAFETGGFGVK